MTILRKAASMLMEETTRAVRWIDEPWFAFVAPALLATELLALAVAVLLCARRVSGAFDSSLPALPLAMTAVGLLAWALVLRGIGLIQLEGHGTHGERLHILKRARWADWLPTAVIVLFAVACSFPGSRFVDWLVWLPALALDRWSQSKLAAVSPVHVSETGIGMHAELELQQITRFRAADRSEAVRGTLLAEFAAGERSTMVYAAFCPPFEQLPIVEVQVADDSAATVTMAQCLHHGVQFDVRLSRTAASTQRVTIEFFAGTNSADTE